MIFGGFNPSQYAKQYIIQNGEHKDRFDIECKLDLWQKIVETFGKDVTIVKKVDQEISIKVISTHSKMKEWVLQNIEKCEVIGPKSFRDEIQKTVMDAFGKYCN